MAHLTLIQRKQIEAGIRQGLSNARIAQQLGVHPSTVGRELKRNAPRRESYKAHHAHGVAASTQIMAAKKRFPVLVHQAKSDDSNSNRSLAPACQSLKASPYSEYHLPPAYYLRPVLPFLSLNFATVPSYYFYGDIRYLEFTRIDKPPGQFRASGLPLFLPFAHWDSRDCREQQPNLQTTAQDMLEKRGNDSSSEQKTDRNTLGTFSPATSSSCIEVAGESIAHLKHMKANNLLRSIKKLVLQAGTIVKTKVCTHRATAFYEKTEQSLHSLTS